MPVAIPEWLMLSKGAERKMSPKNMACANGAPSLRRRSGSRAWRRCRGQRQLESERLPMTAQSSAVQGWNLAISSAVYCSGSGLRLTQALTPSAYLLQAGARGREYAREGALCTALQADGAKLDVARQRAGADEFGKRATRLPAQDVQLEQTVLCLHPDPAGTGRRARPWHRCEACRRRHAVFARGRAVPTT